MKKRTLHFGAYFFGTFPERVPCPVTVLHDYHSHRMRIQLPGVDARASMYCDAAARDRHAGYEHLVMRFVLSGPQPDDVIWKPEWRDLATPEWAYITTLYPSAISYERLVDHLNQRKSGNQAQRAAAQELEEAAKTSRT